MNPSTATVNYSRKGIVGNFLTNEKYICELGCQKIRSICFHEAADEEVVGSHLYVGKQRFPTETDWAARDDVQNLRDSAPLWIQLGPLLLQSLSCKKIYALAAGRHKKCCPQIKLTSH